ncbi:MAG TPA: 2OG-Fe(II) oxygenase [Bdellovibrionota bacterium]|jgi:hypothetical protein
MKQYRWVQDNFSRQGKRLRAEFDRRFADPKAVRSDRFVWDFWNVPGQYTLVRTPADYFFPKAVYSAFLRELGDWASRNLGCHTITPPWLSYYVEGCEQRLHSDVPHGPWAFVYSLSPARPKFKGGETLLLRPQVLDYWRNFSDAEDREFSSFAETIAPRFNRLVVFDPRLPHGVTPVSGTMDPREARLVLHGWFTDPKPVLSGGLSARQAAPVLDEAVAGIQGALELEGTWHGILSVRISVSKAGNVRNCKLLADTLVRVDGGLSRNVGAMVLRKLKGLRFAKTKAPTEITLPLLFR